ncbi:MAG TPA: class I SAM-dependent methyltransferase [Puia sp.]
MKGSVLLRRAYNKFRYLFGDKSNAEIINFKKEIWQTDELSKSFIRGSDANVLPVAEIMDREVNEFFLSECKPQDKVLDIGCGHGIVSEFLATRGIQMFSVDISEKLLSEFRSRIKDKHLSIDIKQGDAYHIPYPNEAFDVVVARMFLPHFPDWPVVLKEMARVTKPGGKLLVHFSSAENSELGKRLGKNDCVFVTSPVSKKGWDFYAETENKELSKVSNSLGLKVTGVTPVSFFLHNRILGYALGTGGYNSYMEKVQEFFKDEKVREFVIWFDKEIISKCSPALTHFNIINFKKLK